MKTLLRIFIGVILIQSSKAQNWCPPGATWHYRVFSTFLGFRDDGTLELKFTNTVTIANTTCNEIKSTFYGAKFILSNPTPTGSMPGPSYYTYENNKVLRIYNSATNVFDTMVDFKATIGDKWCLPGWYSECFDPVRTKITVCDTSHVTINGMYLKKMGLCPPIGNTIYYIERIGCVTDFLYFKQLCNEDEVSPGKFNCYADNNFPVYKSGAAPDCNYNTVAIKENDNDGSDFKFFPNPVSGNLSVVAQVGAKIVIFNSLGKKINEVSIEKNGPFHIDLSLIPTGIYYLEVESGGKRTYEKLVKE